MLSRKKAMQLDFKIAKLVDTPEIKTLIGKKLESAQTRQLLEVIKKLESSVVKESDLGDELSSMQLASESDWKHFVDKWKPDAETFHSF